MPGFSRRRLFGALGLSLGSALLFGRRALAAPTTPAPATDGDFVVVNGWILKRSDLDLIR